MRRWLAATVERALLGWEDAEIRAGRLWADVLPVRRWVRRQAVRSRARPLAWGSLYVAGFCALSVLMVDRPVARLFKAHLGGETEGFFKTVTRLGEAQLYLYPAALLCLLLLLAGWRATSVQRRGHWWHLAVPPGFLFLSIALSGLISNAIKFSLGRLRPRYWFDQGIYGFEPFNSHWGMNSFPSGHSQAAFAAMTALVVILPRHAALWLTVAALVAVSRVVTTVHWLSDAVGGSWLAICVTILLARWFRARGWSPSLSRD